MVLILFIQNQRACKVPSAGRKSPAGFVDCQGRRKREGVGGVREQVWGGPWGYRHWHVRHDRLVWLWSPLHSSLPCLFLPLSFRLSDASAVLLKLWAPTRLFFLFLTLPTLYCSLSLLSLDPRPLCVISCDLALPWISGKCDWGAEKLVVVGLEAPWVSILCENGVLAGL